MHSVLILAALALGVAAQDLTINTPTVGGVAGAAECQPLLLGWSGGTPPYIITVDTQPPGAAHVAEFDGQTGTSVTWTNVNATVGTQLLLTIKDNTGLSKTSAVFPVTTGSGDGCLTSTGGSAPPPTTGSTTPGGSTPPPSGTSTTPGTGSTPASGNSSKSGGSPSSSSSAKASNTPGAAMAIKAPAGVVPAFAAIALAALVALLA